MACTIGQRLRQARLTKALSLEDVSHATKIPRASLEAMEADELSELPNGAYRRGFLHLYCRHLEVDASDVLAAMARPRRSRRSRPEFLQTGLQLTPTGQTIPVVKHRVIERKSKRSTAGIVLVLLMALMLPVIYYAGKWVGLREAAARARPAVLVPAGAAPGEALR